MNNYIKMYCIIFLKGKNFYKKICKKIHIYIIIKHNE